MAKIANINSKLTLNTSPFAKSMMKAKQATKTFTMDIAKAGLKVAKFGAAGAVAAGVGLGAIVKSQMDAIGATSDFADQLGISTKALTQLRYAAHFGGMEAGNFDMALQRMVRRIGDAAQGTGPAVQALKDLGLNAGKLAKMSPDKQFKAISDAMQGVSSSGKRVNLAFKLFDSGGVRMVNVMQGGSKALNAAAAEADKFGVTLTRVNAEKVNQAADAMDKIGYAIKGAGQSITIALAPYIQAAATDLLNMGESGGNMGDKIVGAVQWVTTAIAKASDYLSLFTAGWDMFKSIGQGAIGYIIKGLGKVYEAEAYLLNSRVGKLLFGDAGAEVSQAAKFMDAWSNEMISSSKTAFAAAAKNYDAFNSGANEKAVSAWFDKVRASSEASAKATTKQVQAMQANKQAAQGFSDAMKNAQANTQKVTGILANLKKQIDRFGNTDAQNKILDLKALGASPAQIAKATAMLKHLKSLKAKQAANMTGNLNAYQPPKLTYTLAGSAEAQRLAYNASHHIQQKRDDTPKEQLTVQKKIKRGIDQLVKQGSITPAGAVTVNTWGIA